MRILISASIPFESMRRRQQQLALGFVELGHEVLYINPPRPFRSLIDPGRFELQELEEPQGMENDSVAENSDDVTDDEIAEAGDFQATIGKETSPDSESDKDKNTIEMNGIRIRTRQPGLYIAEKGVAMAAMGRWGWATRAGWKLWSTEVQKVITRLTGAGESSPFSFQGDVAMVYHPALIPAVRKVFDGPLVFDCLDDFSSLARTQSIAAAHEDAMNRAAEFIDGMISVNRYILESWGRLLRSAVPTTVIEHGVDLSIFRPGEAKEAIRSALGVPSGSKMICYLGRFDARISFEDLEHLLAVSGDATFLFVGEMSNEGRMILKRLPGERIMPVGPLRPEQAAEIVAGSDLLTFPFRREPHLESIRGLKLYEYFATGLPVLSSFRRALKAYREMVYLYSTREELEAGFQAGLAEAPDSEQRQKRLDVAQSANWINRVKEVEAFIKTLVD